MGAQSLNQHRKAQDALSPYAEVLRGGAAQQEPVSFNPETWRRYLTEHQRPEVVADLEHVLVRSSDGTINRSHLKVMARDVAEGDVSALRRLFIATMIWGRGKSNGRMMPGLAKALSDTRIDSALVDSCEAFSAAEAYRMWRSAGVSGLGEAFFTKWLWAVSTRRNARHLALVLDARVWRTLNQPISDGGLGWSSLAAADSRYRHVRYQAYVDACCSWADALSCDAEDVEWALFEAKGDLRNLHRWRASTPEV